MTHGAPKPILLQVGVVGLATCIAIVAGCDKQQAVVALRPECPIDSVITFRDTVEGQPRTRQYFSLFLPGDLTFVPEYHDCQRFPLGAGKRYGPLVAIFARESLNFHHQRIFDLVDQGTPVRAVAVGVILSYDGDYDWLGIKWGFNCLYMWAEKTSESAFRRRAAIARVEEEQQCLEPVDTSSLASQPRLLVHERRPDDVLTRVDYPEVARWDWDPVAHKQYAAIGCVDSWCEISREGLNPSAQHDHPTLPLPAKRIVRIKGWYDEQRLADVDAAEPTGLGATPVVGTIMPVPNLAELVEGDFAPGKWPTVAHSWLRGALPKYQTTLNMGPGSLQAGNLNAIAFCKGTREACGIPADEATTVKCTNGADPWWARITSTSGAVRHRCVIRRMHPGVVIPGIVRWRWAIDDERGWIACPGGCCEVVGDE